MQTKTWTKIERTGMHKIEEIEKALNLLDTYDGRGINHPNGPKKSKRQ